VRAPGLTRQRARCISHRIHNPVRGCKSLIRQTAYGGFGATLAWDDVSPARVLYVPLHQLLVGHGPQLVLLASLDDRWL